MVDNIYVLLITSWNQAGSPSQIEHLLLKKNGETVPVGLEL